jgi:hypothetical protein
MTEASQKYLCDRNLEVCCESACTKEHIVSYIKYLEDEVKSLRELLGDRN